MSYTRQHLIDPGDCHDVQANEKHHLPSSFIGVQRPSDGGFVSILHTPCNLHEPGTMGVADEEEQEA